MTDLIINTQETAILFLVLSAGFFTLFEPEEGLEATTLLVIVASAFVVFATTLMRIWG